MRSLSLHEHDDYVYRYLKQDLGIDCCHNINDPSVNVQRLMHVMYFMHCSFIQPLSTYITLTSILYVVLLNDWCSALLYCTLFRCSLSL